MVMHRASWIVVAVGLSLGGAGCKQNAPSSTECQFRSDCSPGQVCRSGSCVAGCDTDRDCPTNLRCIGGTCDFPSLDAGSASSSAAASSSGPHDAGARDIGFSYPSSSGPTSSMSGADGGVAGDAGPDAGPGLEQSCNNATGATCQDGLLCTNLGTLGNVCLPSCASSLDGGTFQSDCEQGRQCYTTGTPGLGVCLRTTGRDQSCMLTTGTGVDKLLLCAPGLTRLVDNPTTPTECACKQLCDFAACPGPQCKCAFPEACVHGVLNSATQGACGTELDTGAMCSNPFDYPFSSSEYCKVPSNVPAGLAPVPVCFFDDFVTFNSSCQLLCLYPGTTTQLGCPVGTLCLDADMTVYGPGYKTCQAFNVPNDGGMVQVPDAGGTSSSMAVSSSMAASSSMTVSSSLAPSSSNAPSSALPSSSAAGSSTSGP